ncbi:MAG: hypothetical protein M0P16_03990 [Syntrophales bacterium]|jgi:hypothetical protein|nr:hypothetical protein [Syntrophales bacterium]MCK9390341.1 hypothetical protein [Syntrophales bacterium]
MDGSIQITCPDLSRSLGFCPDCYQKNVQAIWPYLSCYCDCNRVGAYAEIIRAKDNGAEKIRLSSWKMKMDVSREDFERSLQKQSHEKNTCIEILFKT